MSDRLHAGANSLSFGGSEGAWTPDATLPPSLWELFTTADETSGDGLALAFGQQLGSSGDSWLWVQDSESIRRSGRPFLHGLPPAVRSGLIHVAARTAADALWAMDEGVRCGALRFVVGDLTGDPRCLDFTATRRLVLAAESHGVPLMLLRREASPDLSAARLRWKVASAPSAPHRWDARAPGKPRVAAELFRARGFPPASFLLSHGGGDEPAGDRLHLVPQFRDRPMEPDLRLAG